jgi:hypothetical protein
MKRLDMSTKSRSAAKRVLAFECDAELHAVVMEMARTEELSASHILRRIVKAKLARRLKPAAESAEACAT